MPPTSYLTLLTHLYKHFFCLPNYTLLTLFPRGKKKVGTGNVSVAAEVAEVQRVLKASGLKYTMHSAGTTVEGSWDEVMKVVGQAHAVVHQGGVKRVQTSMRVGTRYVFIFIFNFIFIFPLPVMSPS